MNDLRDRPPRAAVRFPWACASAALEVEGLITIAAATNAAEYLPGGTLSTLVQGGADDSRGALPSCVVLL
jgi:hypothetical protein